MSKYFAAYAAAAVVMIVIDLIWLGVIAKPIYRDGIGHLMADTRYGNGVIMPAAMA